MLRDRNQIQVDRKHSMLNCATYKQTVNKGVEYSYHIGPSFLIVDKPKKNLKQKVSIKTCGLKENSLRARMYRKIKLVIAGLEKLKMNDVIEDLLSKYCYCNDNREDKHYLWVLRRYVDKIYQKLYLAGLI
jgi:hypothetical protein